LPEGKPPPPQQIEPERVTESSLRLFLNYHYQGGRYFCGLKGEEITKKDRKRSTEREEIEMRYLRSRSNKSEAEILKKHNGN
jgi:hypothetical protein